MISTRNRFCSFLLATLLPLVTLVLVGQNTVHAGQLQLSWVDAANDETGFGIERKAGTTGTYNQIATVAANVATYTDTPLTDAATYCYRVYAFNAAGISPYSPEACGIAKTPVQTFSLSVVKAGTGSGTLTSSPAGINCGSTCLASFNSGSVVALTATPASGSSFAGWTGTGCSTGSVTMNASLSCTATFNIQLATVNTISTNISNGAVLSGSSVVWTATPTGSPVRVEFLIDNVISWTELVSPYQFNGDPSGVLNTTTLINGSHQLTVRAVYGDNSTAVQTITVTVSNTSSQQFALAITKAGTGSGTVTSSPAGINCGGTCSATYNSGTPVTLSATAATGSTFAGWSGSGCTTGSVTMNAAMACTATFNLQTFGLSVVKAGTGSGTLTSSPAGINCGSTCLASFNSGSVVALTATPASGSSFAGWTGTGCSTGSVTMNAATSCTATFSTASQAVNQLATRIGVFRPDTGEWFLDHSGNGHWDGCGIDICISSFGQTGDRPAIGNWTGTGMSSIGVFDPSTGNWQLDTNGNGVWDGCKVDTCVNSWGQPGDFAVTRELAGVNGTIIGIYTPKTVTRVNGKKIVKRGLWNFDLNGNSTFDGCSVDECDTFGDISELPVVGDWSGTGTEEIGLFLPSEGHWYLDLNGNGKWDGCRIDKCLGTFGKKGDLPVVGDWDGTGKIRIGVFRPNTKMWYLDLNGNGKLDSCKIDACLGPFGQPGDLPVVGKW